jgi:outer membrane lipoprotein LolB
LIRYPGNSLSLLLLLLLLGACAAPRGIELPEMDDWQTRQAVLGNVDRWEFRGRIGVSAGDEGFNGKLRWKQKDDRFEVTVSGPLGAGAIEIEGDGQRVSLTDKDGTVTEMQDAEIEIRARYGWTIPVESLRYWALGIPAPGSPATTEFDDEGQLARLQQRDWVVTISQYRDTGGQLMPRRIAAVNDDAKVRLVIDTWVFH